MSTLASLVLEDAECEICHEQALPYDDYTDVAYCAQHKLEYYTNCALEDYTHHNHQVYQAQFAVEQLTRPLSDLADCYGLLHLGGGARGLLDDQHGVQPGHSRMAPGGSVCPTIDTCVDCAAEIWMPAYLMETGEWAADLADEVDFDNTLGDK